MKPDRTEEGARLLSRIRELSIHDGDEAMADYESISYSWEGNGDGSGYERFETKLAGGGAINYAGVYHPGDGCCKGNPCQYCGYVSHG